MDVTARQPGPRLVALLVSLALALGVVACGGSDEDGSDADAKPTAGSAASGSEEKQIEAAFYQMQKDFYKGDGEAVCSALTKLAQKQAAGLGIGPVTTCAKRLAPLGKKSADQSYRAPNIVSIKLDGDKAVVVTKKPKSDLPAQKVPYKKEDGRWKMARLEPDRAD